RHRRILKERANLVEPTGQLRPNLRGRAVKGAPLANSLHGRFRPDPLDSRVEIGTHKDRDVDELLAGQAQVAQVLLQVEDLRRDVMTAFDHAVAVSPAAIAASYSRCDFSRASRRFWISCRFKSGGGPSKTKTGRMS